jgi:hypothetical protein
MAPSTSGNGGRKRKRGKKEREESSMLGEFGVHEPNQGRATMRGAMRKSLVYIFFSFFDLNSDIYLLKVGSQSSYTPLIHNTYSRVP